MISLDSVITCYSCGSMHQEIMSQRKRTPMLSYSCSDCGENLEVTPQDQCIYCTYGSNPCPATQKKELLNCFYQNPY